MGFLGGHIVRGSESWDVPPSAQLLSSRRVRIRKISSEHEGLEKAKIQKEETGLKAEIVLSLKIVNILWPSSPPALTLSKVMQLRQRGYCPTPAKRCAWLHDPRVTPETQLSQRSLKCRTWKPWVW